MPPLLVSFRRSTLHRAIRVGVALASLLATTPPALAAPPPLHDEAAEEDDEPDAPLPAGWKAYAPSSGDGENDVTDAPAPTPRARPGRSSVPLPRARPAPEERDSREAARNSPLTAGAEIELGARHVWRGIALARGPYVEPSAWLTASGLTATAGATLLLDETPEGRASAVVSELSSELALGPLRFTPGYYLYLFPGRGGDDTLEAKVGLAIPLGGLTLTSTHHVDVATHAGAYYVTAGVEHTHALSPEQHLRTFVEGALGNAAHNGAYLGTPTAAFDLVEVGASLRSDLTESLFLSFHTELTNLVAPSLRRWATRPAGLGEPTLVNSGVALGVEL